MKVKKCYTFLVILITLTWIRTQVCSMRSAWLTNEPGRPTFINNKLNIIFTVSVEPHPKGILHHEQQLQIWLKSNFCVASSLFYLKIKSSFFCLKIIELGLSLQIKAWNCLLCGKVILNETTSKILQKTMNFVLLWSQGLLVLYIK